MKTRVLVIGAEDFMSRVILRRLLTSADFEPVAMESRTDPTDPMQLITALEQCAAVVNCMNGSAVRIRRNGAALAQALTSCRNPALRVVLVSSMAVYGSATGRVSEDAPLRADLGDYSAARLAAEWAVRAANAHTVILRVGLEYGVDSPHWTQRIARLLLQKRLGDLGAAGDGYCNLVHIEDVALAVERALATPAARGDSFNLALPDPPTWNEYLTHFALALRAVPVQRIGARRLALESKLLAPPLKVIEILAQRLRLPMRDSVPPIPSSMIRVFAQEVRLDSRRAEQILGMTWRDPVVELRHIAQHISG